MNTLRAAIRMRMVNDAGKLGVFLGAADRVYPAYIPREIPVTTALPAYITYDLFDQGTSGAADGESRSFRLRLHIYAITEPRCWDIRDRLRTLFHRQRLSATDFGVMVIKAGTANVVPEPTKGVYHIASEWSLGNAFAKS